MVPKTRTPDLGERRPIPPMTPIRKLNLPSFTSVSSARPRHQRQQTAALSSSDPFLAEPQRETMHPTTDDHPFHMLLPELAPCLRVRALKLTANKHRAEDLVQSTFLKAWAKRDSYEPGTNLRAWLFTILRNTFLSDLRKGRREFEDVDGACARALSEEPRQEHVLALKELISAVATLPETQRQPLVLMGAYGFSQLEAADACGCTVGTIKSRVSRGRATLNRLMAEDEATIQGPRLSALGAVPPASIDIRIGGSP